MYYILPDLTNTLIHLAEKNLPRFSGQNKVLEVLIQFYYNPEKKLPGRGWDMGTQHIKVVFWRPNNAMLVAHNFETHADDIGKDFCISSNHPTTWKFEGLNFFHTILKKPKSWKILSSEVIEANVEAEEYFNYSKV